MTLFNSDESPRGRGSHDALPADWSKYVRPFGILFVVFIGVMIFFTYIARVTRIGAGYVGVEILLSGSQRGPAEIPIKTGWVFYSPLRSQIIEFPTYVQTVKWTR